MPDFVKMTSVGRAGRSQDTLSKPADNDWIKNPFSESILPSSPTMDSYINNKMAERQRMTKDLQRALDNYQDAVGMPRNSILSEADSGKETPEETFEVDLESLEDVKTDE